MISQPSNADHIGIDNLVVITLSLRIDGNPEEPEVKEDSRDRSGLE